MSCEDFVDVDIDLVKSSSCVGHACKVVFGTRIRSLSGSKASNKTEVTACEETDGTGV